MPTAAQTTSFRALEALKGFNSGILTLNVRQKQEKPLGATRVKPLLAPTASNLAE